MRRGFARSRRSRCRYVGFALLAACAVAAAIAAAAAAARLGFDHAATSDKIVALTFDADMTTGMQHELRSGRVASWYNEKVITLLRQQQVPATLFLTGLWIEAYSGVTKELSADPLFELGNHSYSHGAFHSPCYNLSPVREANQIAEVQKTDDLLRQYATTYKKYFRFAGLCADAEAVKKVESLGYTVIGGDVDGADAFEKNPKWIVSRVVSNVRPGSIVVLHLHGGPNAPDTAVALPDIIGKLRAEGYKFVKVSDLLELPPGEPVSHVAPRQAVNPQPAVTPEPSLFGHFFRR